MPDAALSNGCVWRGGGANAAAPFVESCHVARSGVPVVGQHVSKISFSLLMW